MGKLSKRDPGQVLQAAFDDDTQSLRTTANFTGGTLEVSINSVDDNITIGDASGNLATVSDNALNVNVISSVSGTPYDNVIQYSEITGVAMGATENIITYVVPGTGTFYLTKIAFSGDSISEFDLSINSSTNAKQRLYYTKFNSIFDYSNSAIPGYKLIAGTTIALDVTNYSLQGVGSFNATLEGVVST